MSDVVGCTSPDCDGIAKSEGGIGLGGRMDFMCQECGNEFKARAEAIASVKVVVDEDEKGVVQPESDQDEPEKGDEEE